MLLSFLLLALLAQRRGRSLAEGVGVAVILWTAELAVLTELGSRLGALRPLPLAGAWAMSALGLAFAAWRTGALEGLGANGRAALRRANGRFLALAALFAGMLAMAVLTTTYNWDSMTYHLPRVAHWAQDGFVSLYDTNIIRQASSPVLAEFVMLHVYLLTGKSDVFINLVQCGAAGVSALLSADLARKLGLSPAWQAFSALAVLGMPVVFAEAFTAQADIYSSLWLLLFVQRVLLFIQEPRLQLTAKTAAEAALAGLTVAFGYLAKPSVGIGMVALTLWLGLVRLSKRDNAGALAALAGLALPFAVLPPVPQSLRNLASFGALQASSVTDELMVATHEPRFLLANLAKQILYNLSGSGLPGTAALLDRAAANVGWLLALNINDPDISLSGAVFSAARGFAFSNDSATNPLLMLLCLLALAWLPAALWRRKNPLACQYFIAAFLGFAAMGCTLRWQYWGTRLLMPFLMLLVPGAAALAADFAGALPLGARRWPLRVLSALVCVNLVLMTGLYHGPRMLRPRPEGWFAADNCIYAAEDYVAAARYIRERGASSVGLYLGSDSYEYPLWQLLKEDTVRLFHVTPGDTAAALPEFVFTVDRDTALAEGGGSLVFGGTRYDTVWSQGKVSLLQAAAG